MTQEVLELEEDDIVRDSFEDEHHDYGGPIAFVAGVVFGLLALLGLADPSLPFLYGGLGGISAGCFVYAWRRPKLGTAICLGSIAVAVGYAVVQYAS